MCTKQVTHTLVPYKINNIYIPLTCAHTHTQDYDAATKTLETPDDETQTDEQCRKSHSWFEDTRVFLPMKLFIRSELEKIKCLNILYLLIFITANNNEFKHGK